MNEGILIDFLEKAKVMNKAVDIEGVGIDLCDPIQPGDKFYFEDGCLVLDDQIFSCKYISHVSLVPTSEEVEKELREALEDYEGKLARIWDVPPVTDKHS